MKPLLILIILFPFVALNAQEINKTIVDQKSNETILYGVCDRTGLNSELFKTYYDAEYNSYNPDQEVIKKIKKLKKGLKLAIVMGSWCSDSQEQVPRLYKIMDEIGLKDSEITLICVDGAKTGGDFDVSDLDIQRVPTFIFYKNDREIGRIVESPNSSLEKDALLILTIGS